MSLVDRLRAAAARIRAENERLRQLLAAAGIDPFCVTGNFWIGRSRFWQVLVRGQVYDNLHKRPISQIDLETFLVVDQAQRAEAGSPGCCTTPTSWGTLTSAGGGGAGAAALLIPEGWGGGGGAGLLTLLDMGTLSTLACGALLGGRLASSSIQLSTGGGGRPSPPGASGRTWGLGLVCPTLLSSGAGGAKAGPKVRSRSTSSMLRSWRMAC
jgi:hypothetical protein